MSDKGSLVEDKRTNWMMLFFATGTVLFHLSAASYFVMSNVNPFSDGGELLGIVIGAILALGPLPPLSPIICAMGDCSYFHRWFAIAYYSYLHIWLFCWLFFEFRKERKGKKKYELMKNTRHILSYLQPMNLINNWKTVVAISFFPLQWGFLVVFGKLLNPFEVVSFLPFGLSFVVGFPLSVWCVLTFLLGPPITIVWLLSTLFQEAHDKDDKLSDKGSVRIRALHSTDTKEALLVLIKSNKTKQVGAQVLFFLMKVVLIAFCWLVLFFVTPKNLSSDIPVLIKLIIGGIATTWIWFGLDEWYSKNKSSK